MPAEHNGGKFVLLLFMFGVGVANLELFRYIPRVGELLQKRLLCAWRVYAWVLQPLWTESGKQTSGPEPVKSVPLALSPN